jgi:hypothetical protein
VDLQAKAHLPGLVNFFLFKEARPLFFLKKKRIDKRHVIHYGIQCVVVAGKLRLWVLYPIKLIVQFISTIKHLITIPGTPRNQHMNLINKFFLCQNHKIKSKKIFHPRPKSSF